MLDAALLSRAPVDNLVRARHDIGTIELRADSEGGSGRTLHGHFAVFNQWTEINSMWEGTFLERLAPGAFARTFAERSDKIRVLYDHGHDPSIGNKPLGSISSVSEDKTGAAYEVELFEASYVDDLLPALRAGQLGASFRFRVVGEDWIEPKSATKSNPAKLPERTITDVDLYEFGPVTFPAYDSATAGVRSMSDDYISHLLATPADLARYIERVGANAAAQFLSSLPTVGRSGDAGSPAATPTDDSTEEPADTPEATTDGQTEGSRTRILAALTRAGRTIPREEQ